MSYLINKRRIPEHDRDDAKQFLSLEILRLFSKRNAYTDFDWVVKTMLRRRISSYTGHKFRSNRGIIFENNFSDKDDFSVMNEVASKKNTEGRYGNILDLARRVKDSINGEYKDVFTEWDREYIETIFFLYDIGDPITKTDIMKCMGYSDEDEKKFNSKLSLFKKKIKEYFEVGDME